MAVNRELNSRERFPACLQNISTNARVLAI